MMKERFFISKTMLKEKNIIQKTLCSKLYSYLVTIKDITLTEEKEIYSVEFQCY